MKKQYICITVSVVAKDGVPLMHVSHIVIIIVIRQNSDAPAPVVV